MTDRPKEGPQPSTKKSAPDAMGAINPQLFDRRKCRKRDFYAPPNFLEFA
jgi:hypothetical protein